MEQITLYNLYEKYQGLIVRYGNTNRYMALNTNDLGWMNVADPDDESKYDILKIHTVDANGKQIKIVELQMSKDYLDSNDCIYNGLEAALNAIKECY